MDQNYDLIPLLKVNFIHPYKIELVVCCKIILKSTLNCLYASVKPLKWVPTHEHHCVEQNIANLEPILAETLLFIHHIILQWITLSKYVLNSLFAWTCTDASFICCISDQLNQNDCNSGTTGGATTSTCDLIQTLLAGAHPIKALMQFLNTMQSPEYELNYISNKCSQTI